MKKVCSKQLKLVFVIFLLSGSFLNAAVSVPDSLTFRNNPNYDYEIGFYKIYKKKQADVVMLGNSITHGVNWNELLDRGDIADRGIPADNLDGMLARLNYVTDLNPKIVFIMAGINDIYSWKPVDKVFQNYVRIITSLKAKNIRVVVQSTLFVAKGYPSSGDRNPEVEKLNKLLLNYCQLNGIEFIDLNSKMSKDKYLINEYTHDGLHLNSNGYKIWGLELERILKKHLPQN